MKTFQIGIIDYPGSLKSALHGLKETFLLANTVLDEQGLAYRFECEILASDTLFGLSELYTVLLFPPSLADNYYLTPSTELLSALKTQHSQGCILASACTGTFILAASGLLTQRRCTTHWELGRQLQESFPDTQVRTNEILINHGDIITAGGLMSWTDLSLELIAQLTAVSVIRRLGKILLIDTAHREQRYYQQFRPNYQHQDKLVLKAQQYVARHYTQPLSIRALAEESNTTERTLLRRFVQATQYKPSTYLQRYRIQEACNMLESSKESIDNIAHAVGFENSNAFRKLFTQVMGLSPSQFRARFAAL